MRRINGEILISVLQQLCGLNNRQMGDELDVERTTVRTWNDKARDERQPPTKTWTSNWKIDVMTKLYRDCLQAAYDNNHVSMINACLEMIKQLNVDSEALLSGYKRNTPNNNLDAVDFFRYLYRQAQSFYDDDSRGMTTNGNKHQTISESIPRSFESPAENQPTDGMKESTLEEGDHFSQLKQEMLETLKQTDQLIQKMEEAHCRLEQAKSKNSTLWVQVYSDQLRAHYDTLKILWQEAARQRGEIIRMMDEYEGRYPILPHSAKCIYCIPDPLDLLQRKLLQQKTWLETATSQVHDLESAIDQIIQKLLFSPDDEDLLKVQEFLESLPFTRAAASALYEAVIHSFDGVIELYDVLFNRYRRFLLTEEYEELVKQAKLIFEPEVVEGWSI